MFYSAKDEAAHSGRLRDMRYALTDYFANAATMPPVEKFQWLDRFSRKAAGFAGDRQYDFAKFSEKLREVHWYQSIGFALFAIGAFISFLFMPQIMEQTTSAFTNAIIHLSASAFAGAAVYGAYALACDFGLNHLNLVIQNALERKRQPKLNTLKSEIIDSALKLSDDASRAWKNLTLDTQAVDDAVCEITKGNDDKARASFISLFPPAEQFVLTRKFEKAFSCLQVQHVHDQVHAPKRIVLPARTQRSRK